MAAGNRAEEEVCKNTSESVDVKKIVRADGITAYPDYSGERWGVCPPVRDSPLETGRLTPTARLSNPGWPCESRFR